MALLRAAFGRYKPVLALVLWIDLAVLALGLTGLHYREAYGIVEARLEGTTEQGSYEDYLAFYAAGRLVLDGRGDEIYDRQAIAEAQREAVGRPVGEIGVLPFWNPPFVAAVMAPLALLSPASFSIALLAINVGLAALVGLILDRWLGISSRRQRVLFALGYLSMFSLVWVINQGQLSLFILLGWLGFVLFETRGKQGWVGASLGLLLIKPHMALLPLLLLLWLRQWRALRPFGLIAAGLGLISIAVAGPAVALEYPRFLLDNANSDGDGIVLRLTYGWNTLAGYTLGSFPPPLLPVLALDLATLGLLAWVARGRWQPDSTRFLLLLATVLLASMLTNPHLHPQELVLLALAVALGARASLAGRGVLGVWSAIAVGAWLVQEFALVADPFPGAVLIVLTMASMLLWISSRLLPTADNNRVAGQEPSELEVRAEAA
jgi:hypothetical protein